MLSGSSTFVVSELTLRLLCEEGMQHSPRVDVTSLSSHMSADAVAAKRFTVLCNTRNARNVSELLWSGIPCILAATTPILGAEL
ncbi:hypothetical protein ANAPH1_01009 [Anaplasma phagocytophilum]|nr:hypothetical protein ANAPH1_01009 [Anaplasma phagocytophilum]